MDKEIKRFWSWVDVRSQEECWPWKLSPDEWGYGRFKEKVNGEWTSTLAHRRMYRNVYGAYLTPDRKVLHNCDNPICVNPSHLRVGTDGDNATDKKERGRCNPTRKITKEEAVAIFWDARPQKEIAEQYGIKECSVSAIKTRKKHTSVTNHIKEEAPRWQRPPRITQAEADRRFRQRQRERKALIQDSQQTPKITKRDQQ